MSPIFKTVPRTWLERLFSWPWTPMQATKQVRDYRAEFARARPVGNVRAAANKLDPYRRVMRSGHVPPHPIPAPAPLRRESSSASAWDDSPSPPTSLRFPASLDTDASAFRSGGGGEFAGGGASGSWDRSDSSSSSSSSDSGSSSSDGGSSSSSGD